MIRGMGKWFGVAVCVLGFAAHVAAQDAGHPIQIVVDATEAPRKIFHVTLRIPAKPGPMALVYPKWIPGEHGPTGPIADATGLKFTAGGKELEWKRDAADMYTIRIEAPAGATEVEAKLDYLSPVGAAGFTGGASATAKLAVISWNQVVLYPAGMKADEVWLRARLQMDGWEDATALEAELIEQMGRARMVTYEPVTLETLVDSPVLIGEHLKKLPVGELETLNLAGDSEAAIAISGEQLEHYKRLVGEANALFGAHHYRKYSFLFALSDYVAHFGLEHHESSDNRNPERTLLDEKTFRLNADLLAHEMVHSWNGKYRRPAGLATGNYQEIMRSSLLWVYEGLTQYLGSVLSARSGLRSAEEAREHLALIAAELDHRPGRTWRPLEDTATAAQILYPASENWLPWRRGVDFYDEGDLIWLEADTVIREKTNGQKTLDDFCKTFYGPPSGPPRVVAYTEEDVYAALNEVAANDWKGFFAARVMRTTEHAPLGGVEASGWRLVYTTEINQETDDEEHVNGVTDESFSIGVHLNEEGTVVYAIPGMAAYAAGIGPGMKVIAVNGKRYTDEVLRDALAASSNARAKLELLVENGDYFQTYALDYRGGLRYPHLGRVEGQPDMLSTIWKAKTAK